jgi:Cys-tRNA(Pro)/Cys-tRNA(Cys) deacylase
MNTPDTVVIRLLDAEGIPYRLLPHSEPVFTVDAAAAQRGVSKEEMVKCILLRDKNHQYAMACVRGDARVDPKAVRSQLPGDWRRLTFASAKEIQQVTGYVQGAVAPLCLPDEIPILFDEAIASCTKVSISSGDPNAGVELDPHNLIRLAGAKMAPIAEGTHSTGDF